MLIIYTRSHETLSEFPVVEAFQQYLLLKRIVMKFIEMTGQQLAKILTQDELDEHQLKASGVQPTSIVRVNQHGDLEIRRSEGWEVLGGLLGDFEQRVTRETGLEWANPLEG